MRRWRATLLVVVVVVTDLTAGAGVGACAAVGALPSPVKRWREKRPAPTWLP